MSTAKAKMPVTFRILPAHSLTYVRFSGQVDLNETFAEFDNYTRHPDFRPHQSQLIDLTEVRDYERDFSRIMELQATRRKHSWVERPRFT